MAVNEKKKLFLENRRAGIGGSDIAAIMGRSPYRSPIDVWESKLTQAIEQTDNEYMWWGEALEPLIGRRYTEITGSRLEDEVGILQHSQHEIVLGAPDRLLVDIDRGLEIKNCGFKSEAWGKPGTDEVPIHYLMQCAWYMAVTNRSSWDLCVLFGGNNCEIYTIRRNFELEEILLDAGLRFWRDYVETGKEPPIDSSARYGEYLARKFGVGNETIIPIGDELRSWAEALYRIRQAKKRIEELEQNALNHIEAGIGDNKGAQDPNFKLTWVRSHPSREVDYQAVGVDLLEALIKAGVPNALQFAENSIAAHTRIQSRRAYIRATVRGQIGDATPASAIVLPELEGVKEAA